MKERNLRLASELVVELEKQIHELKLLIRDLRVLEVEGKFGN
jgi:hypothetical protein